MNSKIKAAQLDLTRQKENLDDIDTGGQKEITSRDNSQMVLIPAGAFLIGSPQGEGYDAEHPQHKVILDAYYIDKYEVTVAQYRKFCEATGRSMPPVPYWGWQDNHSIVNVSWADAVVYVNYYGKRLPTEAEWEKAVRAGSTTKYCFGDAEMDLPAYAWYNDNSSDHPHPIGTKKPNVFGLYDMYGNAWEWCSDWYDVNYYASSLTNNPKGPARGQDRVLRGGGWGSTDVSCRSAGRFGCHPTVVGAALGFRCASSP